jgi:hypothetical protein
VRSEIAEAPPPVKQLPLTEKHPPVISMPFANVLVAFTAVTFNTVVSIPEKKELVALPVTAKLVVVAVPVIVSPASIVDEDIVKKPESTVKRPDVSIGPSTYTWSKCDAPTTSNILPTVVVALPPIITTSVGSAGYIAKLSVVVDQNPAPPPPPPDPSKSAEQLQPPTPSAFATNPVGQDRSIIVELALIIASARSSALVFVK